MKTKELASYLTKKNRGKKLSVIGNDREDVANLSDLIFQTCEPVKDGTKIIGLAGDVLVELYKNGQRRASRKKSSK